MKNKKIHKLGLSIFILIATFIAFIIFYMGITIVQEKIFTNGDYITVMIKSPYSYLVFAILMLVVFNIVEINLMKSKKSIKYILPLMILALYIVITSATVITDEAIYDYSFYNLKGNKYNFSQVEHVHTGFKDSGRNKGEFYYNIELDNGKRLKLAHPSMIQPSSKYEDDTWQEYVDIDKHIMNAGAKKYSSEVCEEYVDKLLWVIRNK